MIIVRLVGGLGNQLFQYALGRRLSLDRDVPLRLDLSFYDTHNDRKYQLNHFNIRALTTTPLEIHNNTRALSSDITSKLYRLLQRMLPYYKRSFIYQSGRDFDPNILRASRNVYLDGYWQSEKYFQPVEQVIRDDLRLVEEIHPINTGYLKEILSCCAVSLHVRRGDYLDPRFSHVFHQCDIGYYIQGIDLILERFPNAHFFVFSDDIEWVKDNFPNNLNLTFIENNRIDHDWETMYLMSQCQHHIIANSSFSWWGAWLNPVPEKIVVSPQKWFADSKRTVRFIVPDKWIRI